MPEESAPPLSAPRFSSLVLLVAVPLAFALLAVLLHFLNGDPPASPHVQNAFLRLESTLPGGRPVRLLGEWEFLSAGVKTLRRVPDQWKDAEAGGREGRGYGVYQLQLSLPNDISDWALLMPTVSTAWRLKADGVTLAEAGSPTTDPTRSFPRYEPMVVRLPRSGNMTLQIEVSNWEYRVGGLWRAPLLGSHKTLSADMRFSDSFALAFAFGLLTAALLAYGAWFQLQRSTSLIYFGHLSLLLALRALVTGNYLLAQLLPWLPFDVLIRLEYFTVYAAVPLFCHFLYTFYPEELRLQETLFPMLVYAPFLLLLPFLPLPLLTWTIVPVTIVVFVSAAYLIFLIIKRVYGHHRRSSAAILGGGILLVLGTVNDAFFSAFLTNSGNLLPLAQILFLAMMGTIVLNRTTRVFRESERLTLDLRRVNSSLEDQLAVKQALLDEIHHRVKNNLQLISSILYLQESDGLVPGGGKAAWKTMRLRVTAMGLVQESLIGMDGGEKVDLGIYLSDLFRLIQANEGNTGIHEARVTEDRPVTLSAEKCRDVGLIVVELYALLSGMDGGMPPISAAIFHGDSEWTLGIRVDEEWRASEPGSQETSWRIISSLSRNLGTVLAFQKETRGAVISLHFAMLPSQ